MLSRPINRNGFETYVEKVLVPEPRPRDIGIMDNLSSHKGSRARQLDETAGASLLFLPPRSPDLNPIENAFARLKALLRKAAKRTVDGLWAAIGRIVNTFRPSECANYFAAAGHDPNNRIPLCSSQLATAPLADRDGSEELASAIGVGFQKVRSTNPEPPRSAPQGFGRLLP